MSIKLYDLTEAYVNISNLLDEENPDNELLKDTLDTIQEAVEVKATNIANLIKEFDAQTKIIKEEKARLTARETACERASDWLKSYLKSSMEQLGQEKIKTATRTIWTQNNPWTVEVLNEKIVPDKYFKVIPAQRVLDKELAKEDMVKGVEVAGVMLKRGSSLKIR